MTINHFTVLGLQPGACEDDIKKAYRSLAKKWHPDKNSESGAEEKFKEIGASYDYLMSKDRREMLERDLLKKDDERKRAESYKTASHSSFFKPAESKSDTNQKKKYSEPNFSTSDGKQKPSSTKTGSKDKETKGTGAKRKPQAAKPKPQKTWKFGTNHEDEDDYDIPSYSRKPNFSFAFKSFVDDLGSNFSFSFSDADPFAFTSFDGPDDPFDDFFEEGFSFGSLGGPRKKKPAPKPRKRNVAGERGYTGGLNEEYLFSPGQGKSDTTLPESDEEDDKENFKFGGFSDEEPDSDDYADNRFKCAYCGKRMKLEALTSHELACRKRRWKVDSDEDGDEDDDAYINRRFAKVPGDWRKTHAELIRNIRRARQAARERKREEYAGEVVCKWCKRSFSATAAARHIPFCERWTKDHGTPMNPAGRNAAAADRAQRAKEYAKSVPKPKGPTFAEADDDLDSPRHSTTKPGKSFPDLNSGPGSRSAHTGSNKTNSYANKTKPNRTSRAGPAADSTKDDLKFPRAKGAFQSREASHEAGVRGSKLGEGCPTCRQKYGRGAKFSCSCGAKKNNRSGT